MVVRVVHADDFTVDAYPGQRFRGRIEEIRLNPRTSQNVVTYSVIVAVNNQDLKLKPGMTANITMTTARRDDVLTVPNSALRYTPSDADPEMAVATRKKVLDRLEREETTVAAGHLQHPSFGRFARVDGRRVWKPMDVGPSLG